MADRVLVVEDLKVFYNEFQALFGVSLEVAAGETVAILGANGAGKTTLLNTIAGVLAPRRGKVVYRGDPVSGSPAYRLCRRGISMVPEGRRIFPSLTVEENLEVGAYSGRRGPWQREAIYNLFPILRERARVPGTELSGGEQQMLAIGRALMARPRLLLMDEPSMGLAPILVESIFETIRTINQEGTTILLVEQNATMALSIADRGYVLQTGQIALEDSAENLKQNEMVQKVYLGIE